MGRIKWLFCVALICVVGCKKGGPAEPYDSKAQNQTGNMLVKVSRIDVAQSGITIKIVDSKNQTFQGVTDFTGTCAFDFDYKKNAADEADVTFSIQIPKQEYYNETICSYTPKDGPNTFIFSNSPTLRVATSSGEPASYAYNVTNAIWYNCVYDKGGNGEIPISIVAANVPSGWTVQYENRVLGEGVTQAGVTFVIPQNEYRQSPMSVLGMFENVEVSELYSQSSTYSVKRGFQIGLKPSTGHTTFPNLTGSHNDCILVGLASLDLTTWQGVNVPWDYRYQLFGYDETGAARCFIDKSGTITGSGSVSWNVVSYNYYVKLNTDMWETLTVVSSYRDGVIVLRRFSRAASWFSLSTATSSMPSRCISTSSSFSTARG